MLSVDFDITYHVDTVADMYDSEGLYACTMFLYCTVRSDEAQPILEQNKIIKNKSVSLAIRLILFLFFILKSVGATANYKNQLLYRNKAKGQYNSHSVKWTEGDFSAITDLINSFYAIISSYRSDVDISLPTSPTFYHVSV